MGGEVGAAHFLAARRQESAGAAARRAGGPSARQRRRLAVKRRDDEASGGAGPAGPSACPAQRRRLARGSVASNRPGDKVLLMNRGDIDVCGCVGLG